MPFLTSLDQLLSGKQINIKVTCSIVGKVKLMHKYDTK
uniref:Uncharacterized protein n=1 Tax=Arundo donax TaxID=35708 RepID=A0A0A9HG54_ARUDO